MTLRELLNYDKSTGEITWAMNLSYNRKKGALAGYVSKPKPNSFRRIKVNQRPYVAGRLAFYLEKRRWPKGKLQYKDGNTLNTAWDNLIEGVL